MFDKIKQLNELRKMRGKALELQKELEKIIETEEIGSVKVKIKGNQKIDYVEIDGVPRPDVRDVINKTMDKVQKEAAKKMLEMGGGLSGLLGGIK